MQVDDNGQRVRFLRSTGTVLLSILILCLLAAPVGAQSGAQVTVTQPDASQFPQVSFYMEATGATGFLKGLTGEDVRVLENGRELPPTAITALEPGLQVIVAYNLDPLLATRKGETSLFQQINSALMRWAKAQPAGTPDDFTLIGNDGVQTIRQSEPARWAEELEKYQPDLLHSKPGLTSLSQALDMATDPNPRPMMKRALLYVTALPAENQLTALAGLGDTAARLGLRVFVWAALPAKPASKSVEALQQVARESGGDFFSYTGEESLPDPDDLLDPLRHVYQVQYQSAAQSTGAQRLAVAVQSGGEKITSEEQVFRLDVQPPNPIFLDPPTEIHQVIGGGQATAEPVELKIVIEFPDGHSRSVQRTEWLVDGELAGARTSPPFDRFTWTPATDSQNTQHLLQVRITDQLGLSKSSMAIPVQVVVEKRGTALWQERIQLNPRRMMIGGAVAAAAAALAVVLWLGGRQGWLLPDRRRRKRLLKDPVTQPVKIVQEVPRLNQRPRAGAERASWPYPAAGKKPAAWLVRLNDENQPVAGQIIPLQRREITIGSDARQASFALDLPSVEKLHARIHQAADGDYVLADAGSVAGTYCNFAPVGGAGQRLTHGDLVHIGLAAFRFELAHPVHVRKPSVRKSVESL